MAETLKPQSEHASVDTLHQLAGEYYPGMVFTSPETHKALEKQIHYPVIVFDQKTGREYTAGDPKKGLIS